MMDRHPDGGLHGLGHDPVSSKRRAHRSNSCLSPARTSGWSADRKRGSLCPPRPDRTSGATVRAIGMRTCSPSLRIVRGKPRSETRHVRSYMVPQQAADLISHRVKPDGYNTPVPAKILTPDRVETRIGTLEFADGFPTEATSQLLYDPLDFLRGVEAFLSCVPAASLEAM